MRKVVYACENTIENNLNQRNEKAHKKDNLVQIEHIPQFVWIKDNEKLIQFKRTNICMLYLDTNS